jgi:hypothetical protein
MKMNVYAVRDQKAGSYFQPFFIQNQQLAIRAIQDCMSDPGHQFSKHTEDFSLWCIGVYDDQNGTIKPNEQPELIGRLVDLRVDDSIENSGE